MKGDIFAFLRGSVKIRLRVVPKKCGWTDRKSQIILNQRYDILSTCLHEAIHCLRGDLTEQEVLAKEKQVASMMTNHDWKRLLNLIYLKVNGG